MEVVNVFVIILEVGGVYLIYKLLRAAWSKASLLNKKDELVDLMHQKETVAKYKKTLNVDRKSIQHDVDDFMKQ